jgi:ribosome modulation factor
VNPDRMTPQYLQGKAAGLAGLKLVDCPYDRKHYKRGEWIEGFWAGVDERKAREVRT